MIYEETLSYKRGELVELRLNLGGGPKICRALVLNTAVALGRGARQVWILDMDDSTPQLEAHWVNKKHIIPEEDIISIIPRVVIGADTILRENPVCYPIHDPQHGMYEIPALTVTVAVPSVTEGHERKKADT